MLVPIECEMAFDLNQITELNNCRKNGRFMVMSEKFIWLILDTSILLIIFVVILRLSNDIRCTNNILKTIAKKIGIPEPSEDNELKTFIAEGKKFEAIKRYREITGTGLKEANDYINKLMLK